MRFWGGVRVRAGPFWGRRTKQVTALVSQSIAPEFKNHVCFVNMLLADEKQHTYTHVV
jgi:hypothetical protein